MAATTGISKSTVQRYLQAFNLKPHRVETFKLSTDPLFIEKLRDVVGLYLNPPDNALVLCVDEKSQCQALQRTQPMLPLGLGYVEGVTHDYVRHGTTTLFAALNVMNGQVLAQCRPTAPASGVPGLLALDRQGRAARDSMCIASPTTTPATSIRRSAPGWPSGLRWHMHFVPTYSSWLNQVERFFSIITTRAIRRGSFDSVKDLIDKIDSLRRQLQPLVQASSPGPLPPTQSLKSSSDYAGELAGQRASVRPGFRSAGRAAPPPMPARRRRPITPSALIAMAQPRA